MRTKVIAGIVMLAFAAAACGSSGSGGAAPSGSSSSGTTTAVTLGYVPYSDDAALFLAKENGTFTRHGLDVSLVPAANPIAVASSMLSGQEQFGFITVPVLANLNAKGTSVKCVSSVDGQQPTDPAKDGTMLVAAKGSGITSIKDLAGKKVATVQLASLNSLALEVLAKSNGISPTSFQLIQMPFAQMPAALAQGHVQAAIIVSPFVNTAVQQGATILNHPNVVLFGGGTVTCLDATGSYISQHPSVVAAFHAAMLEAITYAQTHQSQAKATLAKYMSLTPAVAQKQILSTNWNPAFNVASINQIEAYMKQFGQLTKTVPASSMIWSAGS
jgi:NitT/TauT family transport system substrate-binding protein